MSLSSKPLLFVGAGGHARVLLSIARLMNFPICGVCCPGLAEAEQRVWQNIPVLGGDEALAQIKPNDVLLVNAVGFMPGSGSRKDIYYTNKNNGFSFASLIHPAAIVDPAVILGDGVQIMAGAVVQVNARIADNSIINSNATVEHDCDLGADNHIAPGATLCGGVRTGNQVFIGANATVIQQVVIGTGAVIAAGSVVVKNVAENTVYHGAKRRWKDETE